MLGTPGMLSNLKKRGYKTFDSIWDESYDQCIIDLKRLDLAIKSTHQMIATDRHDEITAITNHNFANLKNNDIKDHRSVEYNY